MKHGEVLDNVCKHLFSNFLNVKGVSNLFFKNVKIYENSEILYQNVA